MEKHTKLTHTSTKTGHHPNISAHGAATLVYCRVIDLPPPKMVPSFNLTVMDSQMCEILPIYMLRSQDDSTQGAATLPCRRVEDFPPPPPEGNGSIIPPTSKESSNV